MNAACYDLLPYHSLSDNQINQNSDDKILTTEERRGKEMEGTVAVYKLV